MANAKPLLIEQCGCWYPNQVEVVCSLQGANPFVRTFREEEELASKWTELLAGNQRAFPGPTIRLIGSRLYSDRLVLEVAPSNYFISQVFGWLGCAMVPITADGYVVMHIPPKTLEVNDGTGVRCPGCTFTDISIFTHIMKEMHEELNVKVMPEDIIVLGLVKCRPPVSALHDTLVARVKVPSLEEVRKAYEGVKDKWEGTPLYIKTTDFLNGWCMDGVSSQALLYISMVVDSLHGTNRVIEPNMPASRVLW